MNARDEEDEDGNGKGKSPWAGAATVAGAVAGAVTGAVAGAVAGAGAGAVAGAGAGKGKSPSVGTNAWMEKPLITNMEQLEGLEEGLEFLVNLDTLYFYKKVEMIDTIYGGPKSKNMLTIRNANYEIVYYVATARDKKAMRLFGFKYRIIDQFSRHLLSVEKRFKCPLFGLQEANVRCHQQQECVGNIKETKAGSKSKESTEDEAGVEYIVKGGSGNVRFKIKRPNDGRNAAQFNIIDKTGAEVGKIAKRHEKGAAKARVEHYKANAEYSQSKVLGGLDNKGYQGSFVRVNFPLDMNPMDKALILSAALLINVLHFKSMKPVKFET